MVGRVTPKLLAGVVDGRVLSQGRAELVAGRHHVGTSVSVIAGKS